MGRNRSIIHRALAPPMLEPRWLKRMDCKLNIVILTLSVVEGEESPYSVPDAIPHAILEAAPWSETRVGVPGGNPSEWLFPQEKATFYALRLGTVTLVPL